MLYILPACASANCDEFWYDMILVHTILIEIINMEDVTRFILNMSEADSPNSRNARGLRWNHLKQRRNCGANWTSFHCSAAWAVRTVHCLAHCPSTWNIGTENQLHWLQPLWWNAEKLLQLASLVTNNNKQWTIILCSQHCSPASAVGSDPTQHTAALQARCQGTVTRRHGPTLNSAICIDIRMTRGRARTRRRGECCILHLLWPGARQLVVCPGARCFLVLIGKIILLTSLGMITRKQEPSLWDRNYVSQFIWFLIVLQRQTQTPGSSPKYKSSNIFDNVTWIFIYFWHNRNNFYACVM